MEATQAGLLDSFRTGKRRLIQQVLTKLGQAETSDDHEYQILRDRHLELLNDVETLVVSMKSFAANLIALGHGCSSLGGSVASVRSTVAGDNNRTHSSSSLQAGGDTGSFAISMANVDNKARELANITLSTAMASSLQKMLGDLHEFKKEMDKREKLKLDYDSARRKLQKAREQQQAQDIMRRDAKLKQAAQALDTATRIIMKKMAQYESLRPTLFQAELDAFRKLQMAFFQSCATAFGAPTAADAKADEISQAEAVSFSPWG
ncbi:hypothetical protein SPRG_08810 [Saprolegnia parasitica CBS 223.65]|uniref:BAR domain-containing protein n=1 Tax=Saprolegnia parasitica (strain CBS 223.65) TaxID=695850 RepID=A0A067CGB9_SAPPC|nr:hypothetical protein SPRG_08810 [Saprolegnia parasitica CBS 223.65]KDO25867.1 hypothetical protein SPRG_08810 [Saprolegnia parasitica CBS 223.65]|eukprot:XP_012203429.1 hypothetical protein SPRG_08810 [Saprolegnia parasitica CBS 223.65]